MHVAVLQLCKTNLCQVIGCADFAQRRYNGKKGAGITFAPQKRCSLDTCVFVGGESSGCAHKQKTGPPHSTPCSLAQCWHDYTSLRKDVHSFLLVFFMTIICHACVCPAAPGNKLKCCNTLKRRQSKQMKKRNGGGNEKKKKTVPLPPPPTTTTTTTTRKCQRQTAFTTPPSLQQSGILTLCLDGKMD